jgi:hypothetical protein
LKRLHKKPLYKDPKAFLFLVMIILIAILVFEAVEEKEQDVPLEEVKAAQSLG